MQHYTITIKGQKEKHIVSGEPAENIRRLFKEYRLTGKDSFVDMNEWMGNVSEIKLITAGIDEDNRDKSKSAMSDARKQENDRFYKEEERIFIAQMQHLKNSNLTDKVSYNLRMSEIFMQQYTGKTVRELFHDKELKASIISAIENDLRNNPKSKGCIANPVCYKHLLPYRKSDNNTDCKIPTQELSLLIFRKVMASRLDNL
jgi:hypothetical protein